MKPKILITILLFLLGSCKQEKNILESTEWDLNGDWNIHHVRFDYIVVDTTHIIIVQSGNKVVFLEGINTLLSGNIKDNSINCSDMMGVGISCIFIDNYDSMHSETPNVEYLDRLDFIRVK